VALHRCSLNAIEPRSLGVFTVIELMTMKRGIRLMRGEGEQKLGGHFDLWRGTTGCFGTRWNKESGTGRLEYR
jgi:hypothetical protein